MSAWVVRSLYGVSLLGVTDPMVVTYAITHENMAAYGAFADALASDEEWQTFFGAAQSSDTPMAELVSQSVAISVDV